MGHQDRPSPAASPARPLLASSSQRRWYRALWGGRAPRWLCVAPPRAVPSARWLRPRGPGLCLVSGRPEAGSQLYQAPVPSLGMEVRPSPRQDGHVCTEGMCGLCSVRPPSARLPLCRPA